MRFNLFKISFLSIILTIIFSTVLYAVMNPQDANLIVAVVNGEKILYKNIKADPRVVQLGYRNELNSSQMAEAIRGYEMNRLVAKIREIIQRQKIAELGLAVSEKDIVYEIDKRFKEAGIDDRKAKEISENSKVLADALGEWQKDPSRADIIFNEKLASRDISKEQWKGFQVSYDTLDKLAKLRSLIPNSVADMKKFSEKSTEKDLLFNKLRDIVASNVSVSAEEIKAYYEQKYSDLSEKPSLNKIKDSLRLELLSKKKDEVEFKWWQEQYRKAKIEIKDDRFIDVMNLLILPAKK